MTHLATLTALIAALGTSMHPETSPLDGAWSTAFGPLRDIPATLTIESGRATLWVQVANNTAVKTEGELRVEGKGPIFAVEWTGIIGPDGAAIPDRKGIARKSGQALHVALGAPGGRRPESFEPGPAPYPTIWTLWSAEPPAPAEPAPPIEGPLKDLQGTWGGSFGPQGAFTVGLTFAGDTVRLTFTRGQGQESTVEGTVRIAESDDAAALAMDWVGTDADGGERVFPASYAIDGDTMRLHVNLRGGGERPKLDDGPTTVTLTRQAHP